MHSLALLVALLISIPETDESRKREILESPLSPDGRPSWDANSWESGGGFLFWRQEGLHLSIPSREARPDSSPPLPPHFFHDRQSEK